MNSSSLFLWVNFTLKLSSTAFSWLRAVPHSAEHESTLSSTAFSWLRAVPQSAEHDSSLSNTVHSYLKILLFFCSKKLFYGILLIHFKMLFIKKCIYKCVGWMLFVGLGTTFLSLIFNEALFSTTLRCLDYKSWLSVVHQEGI